MDAASVTVVLKGDSDYEGSLDSVRLDIDADGKIHALRFCDSPLDDVFVEASEELFFNVPDVSMIFNSIKEGDAEGMISCTVRYADGTEDKASIDPTIILRIRDENIIEKGLVIPQHIDADVLREMFEKGLISKERYDSALSESCRLESRRKDVERMLSDASYPFVRTDDDMIEDHRLRLIDDRTYSMFVWYSRNRPHHDVPSTEKSLKLKLSTAGLRIMGRYDLCEYSLMRDSRELSKRLYCFTGTLFEGCGNVKAPDDAFYTELSEERHRNAFRYLAELRSMDLLGGNYRDSPFSSVFFDLYTRYDDAPMIHTKGTAEYPYFIRMLMFIIGADDI